MGRRARGYTERVVTFMRNCETEGITSQGAFEKCITEFQFPFKLLSFKYQAKKHGIIFLSPSNPCLSDINPEIIQFVEDHHKMEIYELRDEIIIKFEKDVKITILRAIIDNHIIRQNAKNIGGIKQCR